jgi:hypothetical protein
MREKTTARSSLESLTLKLWELHRLALAEPRKIIALPVLAPGYPDAAFLADAKRQARITLMLAEAHYGRGGPFEGLTNSIGGQVGIARPSCADVCYRPPNLPADRDDASPADWRGDWQACGMISPLRITDARGERTTTHTWPGVCPGHGSIHTPSSKGIVTGYQCA